MKKTFIFTHEKMEGPGLFGDILKARGFDLRIIFTPEEEVSDLDPLAADLVLVMGGPMGVYEADQYPFLQQEINFLKKRISADLPTLGICLGSQLIAAALGEEVYKGSAGQEIGWNPLLVKAENHPIRHLASNHTNMFHWHGDTFGLPRGAQLLASSSLYPHQAYSYGHRILALQCHPEVSKAMAEEWIASLDEKAGGSKIAGNPEELRRQTEENIAIMNKQAKLFFEEWLESVDL